MLLSRVSPEGCFAIFGCYDTHPDSPDGNRILYVRWKEPPTSPRGGEAELCVCDTDFNDHRPVIALRNVEVHLSGLQAWVDGSYVQVNHVFRDGKMGAAVVNVNTGEIVEGPFDKAFVIHKPHSGRVLLHVNAPDGGLPRGVHCLDYRTSKIMQVCTQQDFAPWTSQMICKTTDPNEWHITHATWSPNGKRVAVVIDAEYESGWWNYLWTMNPDGSDKVFFGVKPIHWEWYDNHSIWGNDMNIPNDFPKDDSLRRWDISGRWLENLAGGHCNHGAISPDKTLFAGETWYDSSPVELYLYDKGLVEPREIVMRHEYPEVTWGLSAHVNPAFSRDGKRLFFNRAVDKHINECWCAEFH